jgi:hypothetical protein
MNKYIFNVGDDSMSTQIILFATSINSACDKFNNTISEMKKANLTADNILSIEEYDYGKVAWMRCSVGCEILNE